MGHSMINLLKFPMSAYSNIGSYLGRGALHGDPQAMTQISMWGMGGAMASAIRHEVQGKDYDTDTLVRDAIFGLPMVGGFELASSVLSNPTQQLMKDTSDMLNIYSVGQGD